MTPFIVRRNSSPKISPPFPHKISKNSENTPALNDRELTYKFGGSTLYPHKSEAKDSYVSTTQTEFSDPRTKQIHPFLLDIKNTGYLKNPLTNDLKTYHQGVKDYPAERFKSEYELKFNKKQVDHFR